ncbi:putative beta-lactamase regulatory protein [Gottschalkia acidurici 9a]|uniref:Beta-lactamase regulatory protein n=1 Tax=Gottschalkia acidurici (strain ATCC 7906 / DSM 604 / BCRC 14475 / CIP 104303 / KCTC 5404 / NCIMB 10678 / 9a) TaxID=1128398 RepID=K0B3B1_GOTA9|nr:M56 family metallopeptidase [Gottschalkia acidurici]AFS79667.1 putative beta-lactamase regulatory protein [Gottschalkia acidurici 9a]
MNILEKSLLWTLYSSFIATIMVLLILVIKKLFKNYITPRFQNMLWFLIIIRLLIPTSIGNPSDLINIVSENYKNIVNYGKSDLTQTILNSSDSTYSLENVSEEYLNDSVSNLNNADNEKSFERFKEENSLKSNFLNLKKIIYEFKDKEKASIKKVIMISSYLWIIGVIIMTIFTLLSILKFKKITNDFLRVSDTQIRSMLEVSKEKLGLKKDILVYCSDRFNIPFIYGILKPKIYIPRDILNMNNSKELFYIILHELTHYKRKDILYNLLSIIALSIHWFNPIIWIVMKKIKEDRELACDSCVLEVLEEHESIQYGMTILSLSKIFSSSGNKESFNLHFYEDNTQIERRIMMIKKFKEGSYKMSITSITTVILLSLVTIVSADGSKLISNVDKSISQINKDKDDTDFKLYSSDDSLVFSTLDRLKDFVNFEFKVPNYLPSGYKPATLTLEKEKEYIANFDFIKYSTDYLKYPNDTPLRSNSYIKLLVSKENIKEYLMNKNKSYENDLDKVDVNFEEEHMTISSIGGSVITIKKNTISDGNRMQVMDMKTGQMIDRQVYSQPKEIRSVEKYFIWNSKDIWYGIRYYNKIDDINMSYFKEEEISKDDMNQIIMSFKYSDDVYWKNHISESSNDKSPYFLNSNLIIYDKKDLEEAERLLGFKPKLPLKLHGDFVPSLSRVEPLTNSTIETSRNISTYYEQRQQNDNTILSPRITFDQRKNTNKYILSDEEKSNESSIMIEGKKVLMYEFDQNRDIIKTYIWNEEDILYRVVFVGQIDKQKEIVKTFMN